MVNRGPLQVSLNEDTALLEDEAFKASAERVFGKRTALKTQKEDFIIKEAPPLASYLVFVPFAKEK